MAISASDCALAQLGMTDAGPLALIGAAASAGFSAVGLPLRSGALKPLHTEIIGNAALIREIRAALSDTGLRLFDAEALVLHHLPDAADLDRLFATAAGLGATRVSVLGHEAAHGPGNLRPGEEPARLAALAGRARSHGLRLGVEFMAFRSIGSLDAARALIQASGSGDSGIIIDALHAFRTGATPAQIAALPPGLISHLQICDAPALAPPPDQWPDEARRGRLLPGDGAIPLAAMIAALPAGTPLSVEIPVASLLGLPVAERARLGAMALATL